MLTRTNRLAFFDDWVIPHPIETSESIGCVVDGTRVSGGILTILGAVVLLTLALIIARCVLLARNRHSNPKGSWVPFDLADWQLAFYREGKDEAALTFSDLRQAKCKPQSTKAVGLMICPANLVETAETQESRPSTLHDKFEWEHQDDARYHADYISKAPGVDIQERPLSKPDRQSGFTSPYTSIGENFDTYYEVDQGLLERYGNRSAK